MSLTIFILLTINFALLCTMFYLQRKFPHTYVMWTIIITCFPLTGFIAYLFMGQGCRFITARKCRRKQAEDSTYIDFYNQDSNFYSNYKLPANVPTLAKYNYNHGKSPYTTKNKIDTFADNDTFFTKLLADIDKAEDSIRLEIYTFRNDEFGNKMRDILIAKAKSGVEVSILYDTLGSRKSSKMFFNALTLAGATIRRFNRNHFKLLCYSNAYRNRRNMFILDGKISYVGSAQISANSRNLNNKTKPWHDSVIRFEGEAVNYCTTRFYQDFNFASGKYHKLHLQPVDDTITASCPMQIAFDGPDVADYGINEAIIKAIHEAKERINIAITTYMPSKSLANAIRTAIKSGIEVNILVGKPINKFKYNMSMTNLTRLVGLGAKVYVYEGTIHDKLVLIDNFVGCVGNVDFDCNAMINNFNVCAFVYDVETNKQLTDNFNNLLANSTALGKDYLQTMSGWKRFWLKVAKCFNPTI